MVNESRYNADELNAPEWLNEEFFKKVLKNSKHVPEIKITKYDITPGTSKSDHYASIMFRAKVHFTQSGSTEPHFQSMIVKAMPEEEGHKKDFLGESQLFETEIRMYTQTLPRIEEILRGYDDETQLCAKALYYALEPRKVIVFDDLVEQGYATVHNRASNMEEVRVALRKLAKLHAVSFKLAHEGDESITSYNNGIFSTLKVEESEMTKDSIKLFKEVISQYEDLAVYVPHLERIEQELLSKCIHSFRTFKAGDRKGILVLNHGDFHMKNMMMRRKEGVLEDLMLLDYQLCFFGSAAMDLLYAFVMIMNAEMRLRHRDELFYYYFSHFQKTLKLIEFEGKIPTMQDFQLELLQHQHWELYLVLSFLIANYVFADADGDLSKFVEDTSYRRSLLQNPDVLKELRNLLPQFLHRGYFENNNIN